MKCPGGHTLPYKSGKVQCGPDACAERQASFQEALAASRGKKPVKAPEPARLEDLEAHAPQAKGLANQEHQELARAITRDDFDVPEGLSTVAEDEAAQQEAEALRAPMGRFHARKNWAKLPNFSKMSPEEIKDWTGKRLESLGPVAVMELEYALKMGDAETRRKQAGDVLDRIGFSKKEAAGVMGAPIVIVTGGDGARPYRPAFVVDETKKLGNGDDK